MHDAFATASFLLLMEEACVHDLDISYIFWLIAFLTPPNGPFLNGGCSFQTSQWEMKDVLSCVRFSWEMVWPLSSFSSCTIDATLHVQYPTSQSLWKVPPSTRSSMATWKCCLLYPCRLMASPCEEMEKWGSHWSRLQYCEVCMYGTTSSSSSLLIQCYCT